MLKDILQQRYTAKWWDDREVEQEKINDILECAYLAPSKNGKFDHKIYVLTDSPEGREFKDYLYYENAWCLGERRAPADYTGNEKRFNGQVHAPVVLLWVGEVPGWARPIDDPARDIEVQRVRDDCVVSATIAMCAAEELGLRTGFNGMIGPTDISKYLGIDYKTYCPMMAIGLGYASLGAKSNRVVLSEEVRSLQHPNTQSKLFPNAYNLLINNIEFLQREAFAWVFEQQRNPETSATFKDTYVVSKCSRDIRYVVNAYLQDLQLGTTNATKTVISNYWYNGALKVSRNYEKTVHEYLKNIIVNYILKNQPFTALQNNVQQFMDTENPAEFESIDYTSNLTNILLDGFDGVGILDQLGFDLNNVDPQYRDPSNRKNRPSLQNMIKYI